MALDQDANWCVTWPWFDWILGTRVKYLGTEKELADRQRRQARLRPVPSVDTEAPSPDPSITEGALPAK
jgi:hypothetical protein